MEAFILNTILNKEKGDMIDFRKGYKSTGEVGRGGDEMKHLPIQPRSFEAPPIYIRHVTKVVTQNL